MKSLFILSIFLVRQSILFLFFLFSFTNDHMRFLFLANLCCRLSFLASVSVESDEIVLLSIFLAETTDGRVTASLFCLFSSRRLYLPNLVLFLFDLLILFSFLKISPTATYSFPLSNLKYQF